MPEFILDTSGHVEGQRREAVDGSWFIEPFNMRFRDLTELTQGYTTALFFTETELGTTAENHNPETQSALPGDVGYSDLAQETLRSIVSDCAVVELCRDYHGPGARLLGFAPIATDPRLAWLKEERRLGQPLDYSHRYTVLLTTPQSRTATDWCAWVDITLSP